MKKTAHEKLEDQLQDLARRVRDLTQSFEMLRASGRGMNTRISKLEEDAPNDPDEPMRLLTVPEVAERLSLHPQTVRALIRNGRLKARNFGSNKRAAPRVTEDDLGVFMTETQFQPEGSVTH